VNVCLCVAFADEIEDGEAEEDEYGSDEGALEVSGVAPDEDGGGAEDEDGWEHWVSPDAVGAGKIGAAAAIDEDGGGGEHVEKPLGEDGELEVLLKLGEEEQQNGGKQRLDYERC